MATYERIRSWVQERHGFTPQSCWIAHVKELNGLPVEPAANRLQDERAEPCPRDKRHAIEEALRHFGMI